MIIPHETDRHSCLQCLHAFRRSGERRARQGRARPIVSDLGRVRPDALTKLKASFHPSCFPKLERGQCALTALNSVSPNVALYSHAAALGVPLSLFFTHLLLFLPSFLPIIRFVFFPSCRRFHGIGNGSPLPLRPYLAIRYVFICDDLLPYSWWFCYILCYMYIVWYLRVMRGFHRAEKWKNFLRLPVSHQTATRMYIVIIHMHLHLCGTDLISSWIDIHFVL